MARAGRYPFRRIFPEDLEACGYERHLEGGGRADQGDARHHAPGRQGGPRVLERAGWRTKTRAPTRRDALRLGCCHGKEQAKLVIFPLPLFLNPVPVPLRP